MRKVIQQTIKNWMYSNATGDENDMKRDYRPKPFEICSKQGFLICIHIHFSIILTIFHSFNYFFLIIFSFCHFLLLSVNLRQPDHWCLQPHYLHFFPKSTSLFPIPNAPYSAWRISLYPFLLCVFQISELEAKLQTLKNSNTT